MNATYVKYVMLIKYVCFGACLLHTTYVNKININNRSCIITAQRDTGNIRNYSKQIKPPNKYVYTSVMGTLYYDCACLYLIGDTNNVDRLFVNIKTVNIVIRIHLKIEF